MIEHRSLAIAKAAIATDPEGLGIEVVDVSFGYGERTVLDHISFSVPPARIWGLVGRSGIGKTTLLNVVLGLYKSTAGMVRIGGAPVVRPGEIKGAVFRDSTLLPWLSVLANVIFPDTMDTSLKTERAIELLTEAGLETSLTLLPKELSAGMAKRVELIRALLLDERYFVADEPFSALDVTTRLEQHKIWLRLNKTNRRTGILCTHDPAEAIALCDGLLVLREAYPGTATIETIELPPVGQRDIGSVLGLGDPVVRAVIERMG